MHLVKLHVHNSNWIEAAKSCKISAFLLDELYKGNHPLIPEYCKLSALNFIKTHKYKSAIKMLKIAQRSI